jgi:hypothetical protein
MWLSETVYACACMCAFYYVSLMTVVFFALYFPAPVYIENCRLLTHQSISPYFFAESVPPSKKMTFK